MRDLELQCCEALLQPLRDFVVRGIYALWDDSKAHDVGRIAFTV
jgi:hypothetical protein